MGELLTVEQVAKAFGVSLDTVRRWVAAGRIKAVTQLGKGRAFFFDAQEVERLKRSAVVPLDVALKGAARRDNKRRK
jgi:excisionase family DNA binding protein